MSKDKPTSNVLEKGDYFVINDSIQIYPTPTGPQFILPEHNEAVFQVLSSCLPNVAAKRVFPAPHRIFQFDVRTIKASVVTEEFAEAMKLDEPFRDVDAANLMEMPYSTTVANHIRGVIQQNDGIDPDDLPSYGIDDAAGEAEGE